MKISCPVISDILVDVVMGKKRKAPEDGELDLPKKQLSSKTSKKSEKRLIVVLEGAHLETCKVEVHFFGCGRGHLSG